MSHPLRAFMPQVSNVSMLGAPIVVQILALLYSRSDLSDVLPPAANITVSNVPGPRQTLYAARRGVAAHLPGVDLDPRHRAQHHRAELSRPASISASSPAPTSFRMSRYLCDMLPLEFDALEAAFAPPPADVKGSAAE